MLSLFPRIHNRSLCPTKLPATSKATTMNAQAKEFVPSTTVSHSNSLLCHDEHVIMHTALASIKTESGRSVQARILFDTGSTRTYITEQLHKELKLPSVGEDVLSIASFGESKRRTQTLPRIDLEFELPDGTNQPVSGTVVPTICTPLIKQPVDMSGHSSLKHLPLAEPLSAETEKVSIDVLIGCDHYFDFILTGRTCFPNGLILLKSKLGFIRTGKVTSTHNEESAFLATTEEFDLKHFWQPEGIGVHSNHEKDGDESSGSDHPIECKAHVVQEEALPLGPFDLDPTKFSSLTRMVRVTSWAKRFIDNTRKRERVSLPYLTAELRTARDQCIQSAQRTAYKDIIGCIKKGKSNDMISKLQLFLDDNNLIRCNARLQYSDLPDSTKYPILLPRSHPITSLIIRHNHLNLLHSGASHTLSRVRQTFWIPAGRRAVKAELAKCLVCQRAEGDPFATPKMAPLPSERVNPAVAFTNCGVDYFGPLYVKGVKENKKVWVALYTLFSHSSCSPRDCQRHAHRTVCTIIQTFCFQAWLFRENMVRQCTSVQTIE